MSNEESMPHAVQYAISFINKNYSTIKSIKDIAEGTGASYESLRKAFPRIAGMSMSKYLNKVRMRAAQKLLDTPLKLYTIAKAVGYGNEIALIRQWKSLYGTTPRQHAFGSARRQNVTPKV